MKIVYDATYLQNTIVFVNYARAHALQELISKNMQRPSKELLADHELTATYRRLENLDARELVFSTFAHMTRFCLPLDPDDTDYLRVVFSGQGEITGSGAGGVMGAIFHPETVTYTYHT